MVLPFTLLDLNNAIRERWQNRGLDLVITGGITAFNPGERTVRPYAILTDPKNKIGLKSAKNRYEDFMFNIEIVADNLGALKPILPLLLSALGEDSLSLATGPNEASVLSLLPGDTTYLDEKNYVRCVQEFTAKVVQRRLR